MRLICLNTWGGRLIAPLLSFIKEAGPKTDIFCFQEVFDYPTKETLRSGSVSDLYNKISATIPDFRGFFSSSEKGYDFDGLPAIPDLNWGLAVFFRSELELVSTKRFVVFQDSKKELKSQFEKQRILQYLEVKASDGHVLNIFNFHGLLDGGAKLDTLARDSQFASIRNIISKYKDRKILCGDFNIRPNTEGIASFEGSMRDLVKEWGIAKTRNRFYRGIEKYHDLISDYVFVSEDISVRNFEVSDVEVSDHLPLVLDFE